MIAAPASAGQRIDSCHMPSARRQMRSDRRLRWRSAPGSTPSGSSAAAYTRACVTSSSGTSGPCGSVAASTSAPSAHASCSRSARGSAGASVPTIACACGNDSSPSPSAAATRGYRVAISPPVRPIAGVVAAAIDSRSSAARARLPNALAIASFGFRCPSRLHSASSAGPCERSSTWPATRTWRASTRRESSATRASTAATASSEVEASDDDSSSTARAASTAAAAVCSILVIVDSSVLAAG